MMKKEFLKKYFSTTLEVYPLLILFLILNPILIAISEENIYEYLPSFLILGITTILLGALLAIPIAALPTKPRRASIYFFRSVFIVLFFVTIFYPDNNGPLDGRAYTNRSLLYYFTLFSTYTFLISFIFFLFAKELRALKNFYISIVSVELFLVIFYLINNFPSLNEMPTYYSEKSDLSYGSKRNIIFIFADMLQGSTLEQYFVMHPTEKNNFQGFTLFSRALSPFPFTTYGAPAITTGNMYCKGVKCSAQVAQAESRESSLVTDAISHGFEATTVGPSSVQLHKSMCSYTAFKSWQHSICLASISFQRIFKFTLFSQMPFKGENLIVSYKLNSNKIMNRLMTEKIGNASNKIIFFHDLTPHVPVIFKRSDFHSTPSVYKAVELSPKAYWEEMGFYLQQLSALFNHLQTLGIYDNSLIIITGDHGHAISEYIEIFNYKGAEDFELLEKGLWTRVAGIYNAAILIKPPQSKGDLKTSREGVSTLMLRPLVKKYLLQPDSPNLLKNFVCQDKSKIAAITDKASPNPFYYPDNHVTVEFSGNVSDMAQKFKTENLMMRKIDLVYGKKITNITDYLDSYWAEGNNGAWLQIRPATLLFKISEVEDKNHILTLTVTPLVSEGNSKQTFRVFINQTEIPTISLTKSGEQQIQILIPQGALKNGLNQIKFAPLNPVSPKELNLWDFDRKLSFFLHAFQLTPQ